MSITFSSWRRHDVEPWSRRPGADLAAWTLAFGLLLLLATHVRRPVALDDVRAEFARVLPPIEMRIDLNEANADELQNLPRIGPRLAEAIVADREGRGPFASIGDLARVHGVGEKTVGSLRPHVLPTSPGANSTENGGATRADE